MEQMARNVTDASAGCLRDIRYVLHDRDAKFCASFELILTTAGVKPLKLPARSPNLNAFAERWVLSERRMLVETDPFRRRLLEALTGRVRGALPWRRPHQGKGNVLLLPTEGLKQTAGAQVICRQRIGGLLRYYSRAA